MKNIHTFKIVLFSTLGVNWEFTSEELLEFLRSSNLFSTKSAVLEPDEMAVTAFEYADIVGAVQTAFMEEMPIGMRYHLLYKVHIMK